MLWEEDFGHGQLRHRISYYPSGAVRREDTMDSLNSCAVAASRCLTPTGQLAPYTPFYTTPHYPGGAHALAHDLAQLLDSVIVGSGQRFLNASLAEWGGCTDSGTTG